MSPSSVIYAVMAEKSRPFRLADGERNSKATNNPRRMAQRTLNPGTIGVRRLVVSWLRWGANGPCAERHDGDDGVRMRGDSPWSSTNAMFRYRSEPLAPFFFRFAPMDLCDHVLCSKHASRAEPSSG
jgi:hypothetical protein